ncbi:MULTISPECIES: hypothetical protein [unclassified Corallococcus]|uniref:hypothetical protein n=1 Tax=unclassified Corallococcus TaxID=2685029 RepID=UPI001A905874|nr:MULTISPECIES: hypothetical protein [unclassified Corallococcus]MBN9687154.1 hypothetical protein [Corallococcus sp. NCSPR001]WAS89019.1 hypothetical protein O0N60_19050 [Corallococcus sp. NCRR]
MRDAALVIAAVALFVAAYVVRGSVWWWPITGAYAACVSAFWRRVWRRRPQPESTLSAPRLRLVVDNTRCTRSRP